MAAQFGRCNFDGNRTSPEYLDRVRSLLTPYGPEGSGEYSDHDVSLLWFSFETSGANSGKQPYILDSGEILLWDGRLDNASDILRALGRPQLVPSSDIEVIAAAWQKWGESCFARLVGDWSLSLWIPRDRRLLLAVDFLASRHLCYLVGKDGVQWSSVPDPLILLSEHHFALDEEYLAGWLGSFPAAHLTPFRDIHRVPPASIATIRPGSIAVRRYWDFDGARRVRYARDAEYEAHFLELLRQSVRRRLRSNRPILAELSGGMDSSAIVCVADHLSRSCGAPLVNTVSYYDDREPHWNERPWFERVEHQRGKTGLHVDVSALPSAAETARDTAVPLHPGAGRRTGNPVLEFMRQSDHRVLLSGIGGDEFLGGVPTPVPELEDLLARGHFIALFRSLLTWALVQRRPWIHLLGDAVRGFLPVEVYPSAANGALPSWLQSAFEIRQHRALRSYPTRWRLWGPLPSFQEGINALGSICRQLSCAGLTPGHPFEKRYPFLDRDLLEFMLAIPREQVVRPGERRSLMRRALRGIVPNEVLGRKRKAYVSGSAVRTADFEMEKLSLSGRPLISEKLGLVRSPAFLGVLDETRRGKPMAVISLLRTIALEEWLQVLASRGFLRGCSVERPHADGRWPAMEVCRAAPFGEEP